jgi:branched-chain amino acid transport system ATP-binding protein
LIRHVMGETNDTLETRGVRVFFEGVKALDGVDLVLRPREILGLIGPNGAGKTTLVNVLTGFQAPTAGGVRLSGSDITTLSPQRRARLGLGRTFQSVRLFPNLSVFENIEAAAIGTGLRRRPARELAWRLLETMTLERRARDKAGTLPHGDERRLGIARALATRPRFLLLDEPSAGLDDRESDELMRTIGQIRGEVGCGVLVIEHDMRLVMQLCERIHVLDFGRTISVGSPEQVRADPTVVTAYLGARTRRARARR